MLYYQKKRKKANMRFELDKTLTDDILFCMENQDGEFLLDTREARVINIENDEIEDEPDFDGENRYISLPEWDSNDGFRLMEKFAVELKNPVIRYELSAALNVKKGVFRSFKNALERYPEAEKLWYKFKERKMKDEVTAWYNALREEWGLEPVGGEPEDISFIVSEDFIFREGKEGDAPDIAALRQFCVNELKENAQACISETQAPFNLPDGVCIAAETASGEFCGYICAVKKEPYLQITRLEVKPEYRGMGIGKTLLAKLLEKAEGQGVIFDLPAGFEYFSRTLHIENFKPVMQRFVKN
jgi:ribosomal protein S18 acetylase RimI-like enzyme